MGTVVTTNPALLLAASIYRLLFKTVTLGARAAVIADGTVLLVRHTYTPGWHFPGGGMEPGETAIAALTRELSEEAAIELTGPPQLHGCFLNAEVSIRDHLFLYVVREFRRGDWKRS